MDDFLAQFQFINNYLSGGLVTGALWLAKSLYRAKQDLDRAHSKIREVREDVRDLQNAFDELAHDVEDYRDPTHRA